MRSSVISLLAVVSACEATPRTPPATGSAPPPPELKAEPAPTSPLPAGSEDPPESRAPETTEAAPVQDAAEALLPKDWREVAFPPVDFEPPHARSAAPGDGRWTRLGEPGDRIAQGEATMFVTTVHPHPVSRFRKVTIVAMDLAQVALHFSPGKDDPGVDALSPPAGLVPSELHDDLLVVFNGGFLPRHGQWGMMLGGKELVPPREDGCTVAIDSRGRVEIGPWSTIEEPGQLRAWRQTPPCLLDGGSLHPQLEAGQERAWGGRNPNRKTRRRSALGIDDSGRVLMYGMGTEVGPDELARGLRSAGSVSAAQLDINWSWTKFLHFGGPEGGDLQVTSTLIPKMVHARNGYVERVASRDFFFVTRRQP